MVKGREFGRVSLPLSQRTHKIGKIYIMNWTSNMQAWEVYVNGTCLRKVYSKSKAISLAHKWCGELFEQRKTEVIDTLTGEVVYQIN